MYPDNPPRHTDFSSYLIKPLHLDTTSLASSSLYHPPPLHLDHSLYLIKSISLPFILHLGQCHPPLFISTLLDVDHPPFLSNMIIIHQGCLPSMGGGGWTPPHWDLPPFKKKTLKNRPPGGPPKSYFCVT